MTAPNQAGITAARPMDLSAIGAAVLIAREGRRLRAYRDSVGVLTIGVGHTSAAGPPTVTQTLVISAAECDAIFARDVERFVKPVREALHGVALEQHQFDALVSLAFNIGQGGFQRSSALRLILAGKMTAAADAILIWNRPAEIVPRRQAEYDQFRTPYETALPRARRGDAHPIARPASAPTPSVTTQPVPPVAVPGPVARKPAAPTVPDNRNWLQRMADRLRAKYPVKG